MKKTLSAIFRDFAGISAALGLRRRAALPPEGLAGDSGRAPANPSPGEAQNLLDAVADPLLVVDSARIVGLANAAAADRFGLDLVGRSLLGLLRHPDVLTACEELLAAAPKARRSIEIPETGSGAWQAEMARLADGLLIHLRDATAERRRESWKSDFVANVSHELKSPLAVLIGFLETLAGPAKEDAAARARFLDIMLAESRRMDRLVSDLLSLSRIELNEHQRPTGEVDLAAILRSVVALLAPRAATREMSILIPDTADWPRVLGDADELTQALHNLIDNAIKYGRAGSTIEISAAFVTDDLALRRHLPRAPEAKRAFRLDIRDRGPGIAREHLPRLTERFYRADPARSREGGGTGLGLAIVKHILNRHRGSLDIRSVPGEGSVFAIILPL